MAIKHLDGARFDVDGLVVEVQHAVHVGGIAHGKHFEIRSEGRRVGAIELVSGDWYPSSGDMPGDLTREQVREVLFACRAAGLLPAPDAK